MGYTHYWSFKDVRSKELEETYQKAISQCYKVVLGYNMRLKLIDFKHPDRLSGHTAHAPTGKYGGIEVNGTKDLSHETFVLASHYHENDRDFCKTARKPYDIVVVSCLIILKYYLEHNIDVASDGWQSDWTEGLQLAKDITKLKGLTIPKTILKGR